MAKKRIAQEVVRRYRKKAKKKEEASILDDFCALTGHNRIEAAGVLRKDPPEKWKSASAAAMPDRRRRRGRKPLHPVEIRKSPVNA